MGFVNNINIRSSGVKAINGYIEKYLVEAGENISAGDFVEFIGENSTENIGETNTFTMEEYTFPAYAEKVDDNTIVVVGNYTGNSLTSRYFYMAICSFNNDSITLDGFYEPLGSNYEATNIKGRKIDSNKFILIYEGSSGYYCVLFTITNKQITMGTPLLLSRVNTFYDLGVFNTSKFILVYTNTSGYVEFATYSVTDLTPTRIAVQAQSSQYGVIYNILVGSIIPLDDDKAFFGFTKGSSTAMTLYASIITTTTSSITIGASYNIQSNLGYNQSSIGVKYSFMAHKLESNKILLCAGNTLHCRVCTVSGDKITYGEGYTLYSEGDEDYTMALIYSTVFLENDNFIIFYDICSRSSTDRYYELNGIKAKVTDTTVEKINNTLLKESHSGDIVSVLIKNNKIAIFSNYNSSYTLSYWLYTLQSFLTTQKFKNQISGIANTSGVGGEEIEVCAPYYNYKQYNTKSTTKNVTSYIPQQASTATEVIVKSYWAMYITYASSITVNQDTGDIVLNNFAQATDEELSTGSSILNNKYFIVSSESGVSSAESGSVYLGTSSNISQNAYYSTVKYGFQITTKQTTTTVTEYSKGTYIKDIQSKGRLYPENGKHTDGYWYVLNGFEEE